MKKILKEKLIQIAKDMQTRSDSAHDFNHVERVLNLALRIAKQVQADEDILIPAVLFHDIVVYQKKSEQSKNETNESALVAEKILNELKEYPKEKINSVLSCIRECSFSKGLQPSSLESKVLQDADRLEATGAIAIMRTFSSGGQMNAPFYPPEDPLCEKGFIIFRSSLDLFFTRLLIVKDTMHTDYAKKLAEQRTVFLRKFLVQLKRELKESKIL
ncbi:TPA: phosphohydrolase [Candidatus Nomurabacteria bacterium]|nr:phosphohydrolase [Candidatus Nomurabacteria bacterium]